MNKNWKEMFSVVLLSILVSTIQLIYWDCNGSIKCTDCLILYVFVWSSLYGVDVSFRPSDNSAPFDVTHTHTQRKTFKTWGQISPLVSLHSASLTQPDFKSFPKMSLMRLFFTFNWQQPAKMWCRATVYYRTSPQKLMMIWCWIKKGCVFGINPSLTACTVIF